MVSKSFWVCRWHWKSWSNNGNGKSATETVETQFVGAIRARALRAFSAALWPGARGCLIFLETIEKIIEFQRVSHFAIEFELLFVWPCDESQARGSAFAHHFNRHAEGQRAPIPTRVQLHCRPVWVIPRRVHIERQTGVNYAARLHSVRWAKPPDRCVCLYREHTYLRCYPIIWGALWVLA